MPNAGVHLLLVHTVLERWRATPDSAPFDPRDAAAVRAFLHGSLAPDIGYFPGGVRLFSELAHLVRSADLARALLAAARAPRQVAYALGWATHVLADAAIHPLLNEAGGEHVYGDRSRPVSSTEDLITHMRLEVGLDVAIFERFTNLDGFWCDGRVAPDAVACLADAFREVHGWAPPEASLLASHRLSGRLSRVALSLNRLHSATLRRRPMHRAARVLVGASASPVLRVTRGRSSAPVLTAAMRPLRAPAWLVEAVAGIAGSFAPEFDANCASRLEALPNRNLITGADADRGEPDPRTRDAQRRLAQLVARRDAVPS